LTAVNFRKKTVVEAQGHAGIAVPRHSSGHAGRVAAGVAEAMMADASAPGD
jgi:hypothetical protein